MSSLKTLGGIGAVLTCPCHAVPLVLLLAGTAGGATLARHLPVLLVVLGVVFLASLWLVLRPDRSSGVTAACNVRGASVDRHPRPRADGRCRVGQPKA